MADVSQSQSGGDDKLAPMIATIERAIAFADWANDVPPPAEPGTSARNINEALSQIVGELARIAACYDLKEASESFEDSATISESLDTASYESGQKALQDAMTRLNCPGRT